MNRLTNIQPRTILLFPNTHHECTHENNLRLDAKGYVHICPLSHEVELYQKLIAAINDLELNRIEDILEEIGPEQREILWKNIYTILSHQTLETIFGIVYSTCKR